MRHFPNRSGNAPDTDEQLERELRAAGIPLITDEAPLESVDSLRRLLRLSSGEVSTSVLGLLHGWQFKRAWRYWIASGPGLPLEDAEALHAAHGRTVRVDGHSGAIEPGMHQGFAVGCYHVDTPEGLKALAETLKAVVTRFQARTAALENTPGGERLER